MNRPFRLRRLFQTSYLAAAIAPLLIALLASLALAPAAQATVIDSFDSAFDLTPALSASPYSFTDTTTDVSTYKRDAIETDGLSACGSYPLNPVNTYSVWYTFTPPASGWLTLSTLDPATSYDTVIELWESPPQLANSLACNDDVAGNRRSELTHEVSAATTYLVAIRRHGSTAMAAPMLAFKAQFSAAREFFVDQNTGNDANTGSQALPLRTIGKAEALLPAAGGSITILDSDPYDEAVTIDVPTTLKAAGGPTTIASLTLAASPVTAAGAVAATTVTVRPGAKVQDGVELADVGALLKLADGTYTETVTIARDLTMRAINEGVPTIAAPDSVAVTIAGGAVTLSGLNLRGGSGVLITGGSNHQITRNNIAANSSGVGLENQASAQADATRNWWGDAAGPPAGGDDAVGNVLYRPWCDSPIPLCSNVLGAATRLRFASSPATTRAGTPFAAQPVVEAIDDQGMLDPTFTGPVTLAIKAGTAGAALGGTFTVNAVNGVADFAGAGVSINYVGQGYQLAASSGALTSAATGDSAAFAITADRLVVTSSPANPTSSGTPLAVTVAAQDGFGHTDVTFAGDIALAIQTNPTGAALQGSASKTASAGVAVFGGAGDAAIYKAGVGYTLRASSGTLSPGDSAAFDIASGAASTLVFSTSPGNGSAGVAFAPQPVVSAQDGFGNLVSSFTGAVTLAIKPGTGTAGAALGGTLTVNAVNGVADFAGAGLNITTAGAGYQLAASAAGMAGASSSGFDIAAGPASALVYTATPGNTRAGTAFLSQPVLEARDVYGNRATSFNGAVTLAIKGGTAGAALGGTLTVNAANGVASFTGLSIDKVGTGYQLTASSAGLPNVDSASFDITAKGLVFTLDPVDTIAGQALLVKVAAQDAAGNTDTSFTGAVTLALKSSGGRTNPTLFGTLTVKAVNGVADFTGAGLNIRKAGSGYVLVATASGLANAESSAFEIRAGAATRLVVSTAPQHTPADAALTLDVEAQDAYGNLDASFSGMVSVGIQRNPGGGTLGGTTAKAAANGYVSFDGAGLTIDRVGVGYVLRSSSGALAPADTPRFNITANRLAFAAMPAATPVGALLKPQPVVRAVDRFGTADTTFSGAIALAIKPGTGAAGASLLGTAARPAVAGSATFGTLSIDRVGAGYQLNASAAGLAGASSAPFAIGRALGYVPSAIVPAYPDLVGSFALSEPSPNPFEPVVITATITNTGEATAGQFWVDFYINPRYPPTGANQPWDKSCGSGRCRYGIAWYVDQALAPGQSVTLTSVRPGYVLKNTDWPGYFVTNKLDLYMYIDSWNAGIAYGAVYERSEANNLAQLHVAGARNAPEFAGAPDSQALPALPARP